MFDASDEIYEHIICCVCPVNLSKPCLSYNAEGHCFENNIQDWVVEMPVLGFLFPAFMDESAALNYIDIYQADMNHPHIELLEMLGI